MAFCKDDVSRNSFWLFFSSFVRSFVRSSISNMSEKTKQIPESVISSPAPESLLFYGDWATDSAVTASLHRQFAAANPYPHVVIPNFFREDVARRIVDVFPKAEDPLWFRYDNPIERKLAQNFLDRLDDFLRDVFYALSTPDTVALIEKITGVTQLEADPFLHGGGIHGHANGGKLDMHLDYSIHPLSGKERRFNLIIYLNEHWLPEYGGNLQLWDKDLLRCESQVPALFNSAVLFRTSDISFHGVPDPIKCPPGEMRKSLAVYYVSEPREGATHRYKAQFFARPSDPKSDFLDRLRDIRPRRRIEKSDLEGWEEERERLLALGFET